MQHNLWHIWLTWFLFSSYLSEDRGVSLTEGEKATVLSVLPAEVTNSETDDILKVLSQAHCTISSVQEEDIVEQAQVHS